MSEADDLQSTNPGANSSGVTRRLKLPWWVRSIVVLCAILMALGALIALLKPGMLVGPAAKLDSSTNVYAGYLVSRNLAIAIMLVGLLALSARRALAGVLVLAALVQLIDAAIDCFEARWAVAPGVLLLGLLLCFAANTVSRRRLYDPGFWRDLN